MGVPPPGTKDIAHIGSLKHSTPRFTSDCSGRYRYWYRYWNSILTSQIKRVKKNCKGPCKRSQHCFAQLVASVCTPCYVLLRLVGSCWMKFETGQTSEPASANISIVSRGPTMLRSFAQHIQQCCAGARALNATYPHKYMRTRNKNDVRDRKRPRVLCFLI